MSFDPTSHHAISEVMSSLNEVVVELEQMGDSSVTKIHEQNQSCEKRKDKKISYILDERKENQEKPSGIDSKSEFDSKVCNVKDAVVPSEFSRCNKKGSDFDSVDYSSDSSTSMSSNVNAKYNVNWDDNSSMTSSSSGSHVSLMVKTTDLNHTKISDEASLSSSSVSTQTPEESFSPHRLSNSVVDFIGFKGRNDHDRISRIMGVYGHSSDSEEEEEQE